MAYDRSTEGKEALTAISVKGFKSLVDEQRLEIRPLTLLAGANSSGKSSLFQPLLLMKQTVEASFDPGSLQLFGANARFTAAEQVTSRLGRGASARYFEVGLHTSGGLGVLSRFSAQDDQSFALSWARVQGWGGFEDFILKPGIKGRRTPESVGIPKRYVALKFGDAPTEVRVERDRCFARAIVSSGGDDAKLWGYADVFSALLRSILHVPGLRGNPRRSYERAASSGSFPGTFEHYGASVIAGWKDSKSVLLRRLDRQLEALGLGWGITARSLDAAQVEVVVSRLPKREGISPDFVNIADVGFGVSQVLPVLVALLTAEPGELVYIEQPELHLHPRAQQAMGSILAEASQRGVQVVVETHSSILIVAVQTLVAQERLDPQKVKLHWFQRNSRGSTTVSSADLDELGTYGDWPEDFAEVEADVEGAYLKAVEDKAFGKRGKRKRG